MESLDTMELEMNILGEMILEQKFFVVADFLNTNSFNYLPNRAIYSQCKDLVSSHKPLDIHLLKPLLSRPEKIQLMECISRGMPSEFISYRCMVLIEMNARQYMFLESEKTKAFVPAAEMKAFRQFQENVCLLHGKNDLFRILNAGKDLFGIHHPPLARKIEKVLQILDKKAEIINQKHGLQMIQRTLKHYEKHAH